MRIRLALATMLIAPAAFAGDCPGYVKCYDRYSEPPTPQVDLDIFYGNPRPHTYVQEPEIWPERRAIRSEDLDNAIRQIPGYNLRRY